ncbi:MAG: family protein phosphatase [Solirubrobacteraceae bacterium]|jgi:protein phosphatase|nr:family protein phosphatase [Solirubrobacteraceae bacterium]
MLRVAEKWQDSDVGRARTGNEDSYFVQSPLFVLADGMGGAQAGEVASEIAIEAFREGLPPADTLEEALAQTIALANTRVYDMSVSASQFQGMGTTCTVAYVDEHEVVIAHVGDSRGYIFRDGDFVRLTRDHSLVGELVDRGKVTEEEALVHPQRSVITRAVGPEPTVRVDTDRITARSGDVFLLCSDGLTDMVREDALKPIIAEAGSLEQAGRALIAAANDAGGRDNITVILFRLEEVEFGDGASSSARTAERAVSSQSTTAMPVLTVEPAVSSPPPPPRTAPLPPDQKALPPPGKPRSRLRRALKPLLVTVILLGVVLYAGFVAIRGVFFIGLDSGRSVTIYRGLPYELPLGIKLYTRDYTSGVRIDQIEVARRKTFTDHKLRSLDDAEDLVKQLEIGTIKP